MPKTYKNQLRTLVWQK